ncbi:MAG TPA: YceI family protein [Labilithrix sp.]
MVVFAAACAPEVQRATVSAPVATNDAKPIVTASSKRYAFRSPHARVHVVANDMLNGDDHMDFEAVRGTMRMDPATGRGRLHVEVEMSRFKANHGAVYEVASEMIEAWEHPRAEIDAALEPIEGQPDKRLVTGNLRLHGIERGIRFVADVTTWEGGGVRLRASFDLARSAFAMHARPDSGERLVRDDFTVTFDFRAGPERVTVETD